MRHRAATYGVAFLLVGCASVARAQMADTALIADQSIAISVCHVAKGQVRARTFVDVAQLDSAQLDEILIHEKVHREDMVANPRLCEGRPRDVLRTEVHAYCVSDSVAVARGASPLGAYLGTLNTLVRQFSDTDIPYPAIVSAWYAACGKRMGL